MMIRMKSNEMKASKRSFGRVMIGLTARVLVVAIIFAGGFAFGVFATSKYIVNKARQYVHETESLPPDLTLLVDTQLDLTEAQADQVEQVFDERIVQFQQYRNMVIYLTNQFLDGIDSDIRPILDETQTPKWDAFYRSLRERWIPEGGENYLPFKLPGFSSGRD